jgi:hypothetical protein
LVTTPPLVAEVIVTFVTALVVTVGITGSFLQLLNVSSPNTRHTKIGTILFILTVIK